VDTYLAVASKRDRRSYADRPIPEDVVTRILDAGRVAGSGGNRQPWTFLVVADDERKRELAQEVYEPGNIRGAALVVAIATRGGRSLLDVGRAMQNMMLTAWNEGVVSCPNGMRDNAQVAQTLALEDDLQPVIVLSFGYPARPLDPDARGPDEWSARANRKPLEEVVRRI
jgi:nitroreductase